MAYRKTYDDDDGRTVADMSGIEQTPMFIPSADSIRRLREGRDSADAPDIPQKQHGPEYIDREGRRAMIGGAISAMLLVGGIVFALFAVVILIIGHLL